jgi:hypothetical protein
MPCKRECCAIALGCGINEGGCRNDAAAMQLFITTRKMMCDEILLDSKKRAENGAAEYFWY